MLFTLTADDTTTLIDTPAEHYDVAATGAVAPDTFIVEPRLTGDPRELDAILTDYLHQAAAHGRVPMTFSALGDFLGTLAA